MPRVYGKATGVLLSGPGCRFHLSFSLSSGTNQRITSKHTREWIHPVITTRHSFNNTLQYLSTMTDATSTRSSSSSSISSSDSSSSSTHSHYSSPTRTPLGRVDSSTHVFPAKPPKTSLSKRSDGAKNASSDGLKGFPATRCKKTNQLFNGLDWVLEAITEPKSK